jgi:diaminopimelate epimerase
MTFIFHKCHGAGNDFIILDDRRKKFPAKNGELISALCNRRTGIGADGLILLRNHSRTDFEMLYYNADGRLGSMCGNGGRCAAALAYKLGAAGKKSVMTTIDGIHSAEILSSDSAKENFIVKISMGDVHHIRKFRDCIFIDTGSPHCVLFVDDVDKTDIIGRGKKLRFDERFAPGGANINFVEPSKNKLYVRTYERGVEDETLSCGTGVVASALTTVLNGKNIASEKTISIKTPGGNLKVHFAYNGKKFTNVFLEGPAAMVYTGEIDI